MVVREHQTSVLRPDELPGDRMLDLRQERIVEAGHVQQTAGLGVEPQLRPGENFAEFIERAEAAGQGDERVAQLRHQRLALVHRVDDAQFGDASMRQLARHQRPWDHADDLAASGQSSIGQLTHEADVPASINKANPPPRQKDTELERRSSECGVVAMTGATKDRDASHPATVTGESLARQPLMTGLREAPSAARAAFSVASGLDAA